MLAYFAALLCTVSAAKYCCSPDQWQGSVRLVMITISNGTTGYVEGAMNMSFDGVNRIVAYDQALTSNDKPLHQRIVNDHKNNVMYIITADDCFRSRAAPWISGCIPDNATEFSDTSVYGYGDNSVRLRGFSVQYGNYEMYVRVTADTCVPFNELITGDLAAISGQSYQSTSVTASLTFVNIKAGISSRDIFSVPSQCKAVPVGQAVGRRSLYFI